MDPKSVFDTLLDLLPNTTLMDVMLMLNPSDLLNMCRVDNRTEALCNDESFWKVRYHRDFSGLEKLFVNSTWKSSWLAGTYGTLVYRPQFQVDHFVPDEQDLIFANEDYEDVAGFLETFFVGSKGISVEELDVYEDMLRKVAQRLVDTGEIGRTKIGGILSYYLVMVDSDKCLGEKEFHLTFEISPEYMPKIKQLYEELDGAIEAELQDEVIDEGYERGVSEHRKIKLYYVPKIGWVSETLADQEYSYIFENYKDGSSAISYLDFLLNIDGSDHCTGTSELEDSFYEERLHFSRDDEILQM